MIAADPRLLLEAKGALPSAVERATKRAGAVLTVATGMTGTEWVIAARFETYPQPKRSDGQWAIWWSDYHEALDDLPLASLEAGMRAWVKSSTAEFLPKPGVLRKLAMETPTQAASIAATLKAAVRAADQRREAATGRTPLTDEEKAARKAMVDDALARICKAA